MQERIDRIEDLVTSLISQSPGHNTQDRYPDEGTSATAAVGQSSLTSGSTAEDGAAAYQHEQHGVGVMSLNESCSSYRGPTHWSDVLQEVCIISLGTHSSANMTIAAQWP